MRLFNIIIILINANLVGIGMDSFIQSDCKCYNYCKLGGAAIYSLSTGAEISLGRRYEENDHAMDISIDFFKAPNGLSFSIPKINYIIISTPDAPYSFYRGMGLSWGGIERRKPKKKFYGLKGDILVGYDLQREGALHSFIELALSQSLVPTSVNSRLFLPEITCNYGIGF